MSTSVELPTVKRVFATDEVIFKERELASCAYVIERGKVVISTELNGERRILATMGPGEMFGEMAALDGTERSASASAAEDTELIIIAAEQLRARVESADPVLKLVLRVILNRFRHEQNLFRHMKATEFEPISARDGVDAAGAIDKMKLESELGDALERNELSLHYQPIVKLDSRSLEGFEALLRWSHPELGNVSPQKFIGIAEETALIVPIGQWVLTRALEDLERLRDRAGRELSMNVNVSGRQFAEPSFRSDLELTLRSADIDPAQLKLEITEGVLMDYRSAPLKWIERCKELGVRVALDDFGTGFSSLSYLASFPIDTLKIDRSFVMAMGQDERSLKIVRSISQLAHGIGLDLVAEGIEDPEQQQQLAAMGCEYGQGYYFSRPLPLEDALDFVCV